MSEEKSIDDRQAEALRLAGLKEPAVQILEELDKFIHDWRNRLCSEEFRACVPRSKPKLTKEGQTR